MADITWLIDCEGLSCICKRLELCSDIQLPFRNYSSYTLERRLSHKNLPSEHVSVIIFDTDNKYFLRF